MRVAIVTGLVLATLVSVVAASFAIPANRGKHENEASGTQRSTTGRKVDSEHTSRATVGERQTSETSVEVLISGDPGVRFSGEIETPNGASSVEGTVPEVYPIATSDSAPEPGRITVTVHKEHQAGTLRAEVVRNGRVVASQETSARSGLAQVTWSDAERG